MPNLDLSQFNVFIGETGAIDCHPDVMLTGLSSIFYDLPNFDLQALDRTVDRVFDGLNSSRKEKVIEMLRAIGMIK